MVVHIEITFSLSCFLLISHQREIESFIGLSSDFYRAFINQ